LLRSRCITSCLTLRRANQYTIAGVTRDFVRGGNWTLTRDDTEHKTIIAELQRNATAFERLEPDGCIRAYGVDFLSARRHVLVVAAIEGLGNSLLGTLDWSYGSIQNSWVCGTDVAANMTLHPKDSESHGCTVREAISSYPPMSIANRTVEYCLSQRVADECKLQFSLPIMLVIIFCNMVKLFCILLTLMKYDPTLITIGDAIASFLKRPEPLTRGMSSLTMEDIKAGQWPSGPTPYSWRYKRYFWWQAIGIWKWLAVNLV
jgi:hypothetical protein